MRRLLCWLFGHRPNRTIHFAQDDGLYYTMPCQRCKGQVLDPGWYPR